MMMITLLERRMRDGILETIKKTDGIFNYG